MASIILMAVVAVSSVTLAAAQQPPSFNTTFQPWEVMGPVKATSGRGYALLELKGDVLEYSFYLYNVKGLKNVELHVGEPGTHGVVAAVFWAVPFAKPTAVTGGLVARGNLTNYDLVGPFLLPTGEHLEVSLLHDKFIMTGNAAIVVHTDSNPGGELSARPAAAAMMMASNPAAPADMMHGRRLLA